MLRYLSSPFKWFFKLEAASGLVLLFAAVMALIISNSNLSELYFSTLNKYLFFGTVPYRFRRFRNWLQVSFENESMHIVDSLDFITNTTEIMYAADEIKLQKWKHNVTKNVHPYIDFT